MNKSYSKQNKILYAGGLTVVEDGKPCKSPRTVDKWERYFQHTWIESTLGEHGGNVGGI